MCLNVHQGLFNYFCSFQIVLFATILAAANAGGVYGGLGHAGVIGAGHGFGLGHGAGLGHGLAVGLGPAAGHGVDYYVSGAKTNVRIHSLVILYFCLGPPEVFVQLWCC